MRGVSKFLTLVAMTAAVILPVGTAAAATTTVDYNIAGTASSTLFPASLAGVAVSAPHTEIGVWTAELQPDLGVITAGRFTFRSKVHTFTDTEVAGTFGPASGTCAKTTIPIRGELDGGGLLDVTLTRYGSMSSGQCVVSLSIVRGTARLVFPS